MSQGPLIGPVGSRGDTAATTDAGTFSLIALVKRLHSRLTSGDSLIGIKGVDDTNPASYDNPLPVSMPSMAAVTASTTPDISGNGHDGTLRGSVLPQLVPSPWSGFENALLFDGVNRGINSQCVDAGNSVSGVASVSGVGTAAKFCLEAKARTGASIPSQEIIAGRVSSGVAGGFQPMLYSVAGKFAVSVRDNGGVERDVVGATSLVINTKYDVAASYDGTTLRLFVNGVLDGSVGLTGVEAADATTRFLIGIYDDPSASVSGGYPWNGIIDEVRWSNTSRYSGAYTPSTTPFARDDFTLGLWPFDQQFGTIAVTGPVTQAQLEAELDEKLGDLGQKSRADSAPVTLSTEDIAALSPPSPYTGGLTDTQLRATPVPISGTVTANTGLSQPLTDTQLRASAVPVSGPLTDTQIRAAALPVSGTVTANAGTNLNTSALALESGGNLASIKAKTDNIPAQGQALAAASLPVVLPAAQVTALTPPAAITGFALETTQTAGNVLTGAVTETAPATDTASSGLNGRLQRIAQRLTSIFTTQTDGTQTTQIVDKSLTKKTVTASASGDTTVHTPAAGKKIRLYFFGYSAGANITGCLVGLKLAGYNSGAVFDQQYLIAAGQPYARNIQGGKRYIEGSADGLLTVNLGAAQTVYVNYELEEI